MQRGALERTGGAGQLDKRIVAREVTKRTRAMQICYEQHINFQAPALRGTVTVEFTVEPDGTISSATAAAGADPRLAACAVDTAQRFRFNPGPHGGSVSYRFPITFHPEER